MKKRVLHVFGSLNIGGAETRTLEIFRAINKDEYSFDFICMQQDKQFYEDEIISLGGKIFKITPPRENTILNFKEILGILWENHYDAVHAHTSFHCGVVALAAKIARVPIRISHARTTGSKNRGFINKIFLFFGKALITLCSTHCLAISSSAAAYLFGKNYKKNNKVSVLPNSIDESKYDNVQQTDVDKVMNKFSLSREEFIIGHVGRFEPMKNHKFLIDLMREIVKKDTNIKLVLIGEGKLKEDIEQRVKEYNLENFVVFCGARTDIPIWMNIFDVVVMPSVYEGLCGVAIEAQTAGTPCVLSNGIPKAETDLGLGLCKYLSLDDSLDEWIETIMKSKELMAPNKSLIFKKLYESGYALNAGLENICRIYSGRKEK